MIQHRLIDLWHAYKLIRFKGPLTPREHKIQQPPTDTKMRVLFRVTYLWIRIFIYYQLLNNRNNIQKYGVSFNLR